MKKLLFLLIAGMCLLVSGTAVDCENFSAWNTAKNLPENWSLLKRDDRLNKVEKTAGGILLNGMIISEKMPMQSGGVDVKITLKVKSVKKFLKVYLFYYYNLSDTRFNQVGQAFDLQKSDGDTYVTSLRLSRRGQKFYAVVLDGEDAEISSITFTPIEKKEIKNIPCEIPIVFNAQAPAIKKINPDEWRKSSTFINPFRSTSQKINFIDNESVSMRTDGKKLYLLFTTPNYRSGKHNLRDGEIFKDSSVEIVLQPITRDRIYHIVANWDGAVYDEEIAVGQSFVNWNCPGLETGTAVNGKTSMLAIAIPFAAVNIKPDESWSMNICRNRPEYNEFAAMNNGGYLRNLMTAEIVRNLDSFLAGITRRGNDIVFQAKAKAENLQMHAAEYGGLKFEGSKPLNADGGMTEIITKRQELPDGTFEFSLTNNGKRFYRTDVQFGKIATKNISKETLSQFIYFPIQKKAAVIFQGLSFSQMRDLDRVECIIGKDKVIIDKFTSNRNVVIGQKAYSIPADGRYHWQLKVFSKDGKIMEENSGEFTTRKDFEWLGNDLGKDRIVIPPFTKMSVKGNTVSCTLRDIKFGKNGFPESIIAAGKEVLSAPVKLYYLDEKGREIPFNGKNFKITSQADDRVEMQSSSQAGFLKTSMSAWMEYDGVFFYNMELDAEKPTKVKKLYLEVPVEQGDLFHAVGAFFRSHLLFWRTKELPGDGIIWKSSKYPVESGVVGSFLPSVWLGTFRNGISFFAESDRNWINSKKSDCIELIRRNGKIVLRINFVAKSATLKGKRNIEFGFVATPLRKRPVGAEQNFKWGTSFARTFFNKGLMAIDPFITNMMLNPARKSSYVAYTAGQEYIDGDPEFQKFAVELDKEYKSTFNPWEVELMPYRTGGMNYADYISRNVVWNSYRVDFMIWRLNQLLRDTGVDGIYQDNSYATFSLNQLLNDQTFVREDGKLQGIYHFLAQREYLKRCAVLAYKYNKRYPRVILHNTGAMMPAAFAFVDGFMDGEVTVKRYYDAFPMPWNEIMLGVDWGMVPGRLTMLRQTEKNQNRALFSIFKLYDMRFWITHNGFDNVLYSKVRKAENSFGIGNKGTEFFGYWDEKNPVSFTGKTNLLASCFKRQDGALLIYVSNTTRQTASGNLKFNQKMKLSNALDGSEIKFPLTIPGEDFISILAIPQK